VNLETDAVRVRERTGQFGSPAVCLWLRIGAFTLLSVVLGATRRPPAPDAQLALVPALTTGVAVGFSLYLLVAWRRLGRPHSLRLRSAAFARLVVLGVCALNEEVVWRWFVLGTLLTWGTVAALAGSTLGFATVHRNGSAFHLLTGTTFGTVYLATGSLLACAAAHLAYNSCVAYCAERSRPLVTA